MGRIIAIDWGKKRTGLAWTDPLKIIATGIGSYDTNQLVREIQKLVASESIDSFLLGFPSRLDGRPTDATGAVLAFKLELEKLFPGCPVTLWDERFTSKMAMQAMIEAGVPKMKRRDKHLVNQVSATILLKEYLETNT